MSEDNLTLNKDEMMERGRFTANGYTFVVRPVYLGEEDAYFEDMKIRPTPPDKDDGTQYSDTELGRYAMVLFSRTTSAYHKDDRKPAFGGIKRLFRKLFPKKDYTYYSDLPAVMPLVKWLERKVTYKGRKIRFYDLERKFGLNKTEIQQLIDYFHEISGFF